MLTTKKKGCYILFWSIHIFLLVLSSLQVWVILTQVRRYDILRNKIEKGVFEFLLYCCFFCFFRSLAVHLARRTTSSAYVRVDGVVVVRRRAVVALVVVVVILILRICRGGEKTRKQNFRITKGRTKARLVTSANLNKNETTTMQITKNVEKARRLLSLRTKLWLATLGVDEGGCALTEGTCLGFFMLPWRVQQSCHSIWPAAAPPQLLCGGCICKSTAIYRITTAKTSLHIKHLSLTEISPL